MKKQFFTKSGFISITLLAALQAAPAIVSADVSSNVSASSNYLFRGVTQTDCRRIRWWRVVQLFLPVSLWRYPLRVRFNLTDIKVVADIGALN